MKCRGRDAITGERIEVEFDAAVQHVDPILDSRGGDTNFGANGGSETWIAPGFIDLQTNGFAGADFNSPWTTPQQIDEAITAVFSTGVTRFFPTVITGAPEEMIGALRNLAAARESLENGGAMEAFHVEGPHISPEDGPRGAHPVRWARPPDFDEFRRLQDAARGHIRMVTLAPEWPGAPRYIDQVTRQGVVVSIGHTRPTAEQITEAVAAGATLSTHLGNAADSVLPRRDNYIWRQLAEDRLAATFIADGHHLSNSFLLAALRAKGIERSVLVTDATMPALCAPGPYMLGGVAVELTEDDRVVLRGGTRLAGSSLRMDQAIGNVMKLAGVSLAHAVTMATINAARAGRVPGRLRGIQPGERADLVRFRLNGGRVEIFETYLSGRKVFGG
jgi:N-acetylglucosamine-6-phosphate deacetylase